MTPLLALILAQAAASPPIEPPHGVNDAVVGTVEEYTMVGPMRVCMVEGGIDLIEGETAHLSYLGIHSARLRIIGAARDYTISEGDIWAAPKAAPHGVDGAEPVKAMRFGSRHEPRYALYGRPDYSPDKDRLMIWLSGLRGGKDDVAVIRRISTQIEDKKSCKRRFLYGWFFDEGDAPK